MCYYYYWFHSCYYYYYYNDVVTAVVVLSQSHLHNCVEFCLINCNISRL